MIRCPNSLERCLGIFFCPHIGQKPFFFPYTHRRKHSLLTYGGDQDGNDRETATALVDEVHIDFE